MCEFIYCDFVVIFQDLIVRLRRGGGLPYTE